VGMLFAKTKGAVIESLLNFRQQGFQPLPETVLRNKRFALFARLIAARHADGSFLDVFGTNLHADRNAFQLPFVKFVSWTVLLAIINFEAQAAFPIGAQA